MQHSLLSGRAHRQVCSCWSQIPVHADRHRPQISSHLGLQQLARPASSTQRRHIRSGRLSCSAIFKFKNPLRQSSDDAGTYGSQKREDYTNDDVEQYFNYMGMLAAEGTYDRLEEMLNTGTAPVDLLLLMSASENDAPKMAELIRAGANLDVKDTNGKTAKDIATSDEAQELLAQPKTAYSF